MSTSLVLRACDASLRSHEGFQWPDQIGTEVIAPDWSAEASCGNGLHGWLYGAGDASASSYHEKPESKWLVVEVETAALVMLGGKVKFPRCFVRFVGTRDEAVAYILANCAEAKGAGCIYAHVTVGDQENATVGHRGTATAGESGTATAGYRGTATAGDYGELRIAWWDKKSQRYRTKICYIGEDGLKPNVAYRLDENQQFVKVTEQALP